MQLTLFGAFVTKLFVILVKLRREMTMESINVIFSSKLISQTW